MINGATQIIAGVPGKHLDPSLLARSQSSDSVGFIMIAYHRQSTEETHSPSWFFDLLFFRGPEIFECARMNQDLRFQLHHEAALDTFRNLGRREDTRVFLFLAPDELLHRFRSTFYYEPCLKVQVNAVSKKQIITLLKSTGCQRGIIECNEFTPLAPSLELLEISAPEDIIQYRPRFKHGRILLYDTEKNRELVQERYSATRLDRSSGAMSGTKEQNDDEPGRPSIQILNTSERTHKPLTNENEVDEFTEFIKKILNSPPTVDPKVQEAKDTDGPSFIITRKQEKDRPGNEGSDAGTPDPARKPRSLRKFKPRRRRAGETQIFSQSDSQSGKSEQAHPAPSSTVVELAAVPDHQDYVKLFERLFRSFRQQIFDCYGDKSEAVISDAERRVRFLTPEFDLHSLNNETAIVTLDLVESIANDAPFFKKSKLREAALTLVADLYNKQYELLEHHRALEKVEQFYYRLKR